MTFVDNGIYMNGTRVCSPHVLRDASMKANETGGLA
jgi:hypothetical protein